MEQEEQDDDQNNQLHDYAPPSTFDRLTECWTDCMNSIENSKFVQQISDKYTYEQIKENTSWFLDKASFSITFDDIMLVMTLFVLLGENIELATLEPYAGI